MAAKKINLNPQGISRKEKTLMQSILADPDHVFCSSDIVSAEPSITAHYSQDTNYRLATVDMVGKRPYYDKSNLLVVDDIYLMLASVYPEWAATVREVFNETYDGMRGFDKWMEDSEFIKHILKRVRGPAKSLGLGIGYGLGPKNMILFAAENGFEMSLAETRAFFKLYWDTFPRVRLLAKKLEKMYKEKGYIQNEFGFCLYPSDAYKCLNYLIQSSVTGLMHVLKGLYFNRNPWIDFVLIMHDELVFQVPEHRQEEAKRIYFECVDELNKMLGWSVQMRFGWNTGKTLYECK